jgi:Lar family restriction alleviation protein
MAESKVTELKPCPFCGAAATIQGNRGGGGYVFCSNNECPAQPQIETETEADAVAAWNTRADEARIAEDEKQLSLLRTYTVLCPEHDRYALSGATNHGPECWVCKGIRLTLENERLERQLAEALGPVTDEELAPYSASGSTGLMLISSADVTDLLSARARRIVGGNGGNEDVQ